MITVQFASILKFLSKIFRLHWSVFALQSIYHMLAKQSCAEHNAITFLCIRLSTTFMVLFQNDRTCCQAINAAVV